MSIVVSDTSPLHYLVLCGAETVLPRLFSQVVLPPTVGILEQAAERQLLDLPAVLSNLEKTNARLNPDLIRLALERDKFRKKVEPSDE